MQTVQIVLYLIPDPRTFDTHNSSELYTFCHAQKKILYHIVATGVNWFNNIPLI